MVSSISAALARIKDEPHVAIDPAVLECICRESGLEWRQTVLSPPVTLSLLARQVIAGNVSCAAVARMAERDGPWRFTAEGYRAARARLPIEVVRAYALQIGDAARGDGGDGSGGAHAWRGHRTWLVDGSSCSMPDTPELMDHFGCSGVQTPGCAFPIAHLLALFDAGTGMLRELIASPLRTGDMTHAAALHPNLGAGDILLGDQSFSNYAHVALLLAAGAHALLPAYHQRIVDFTPNRPHADPADPHAPKGLPRSRWIKSLGGGGSDGGDRVDDQLVEWFKPRERPAWMTQAQYDALPASIVVRELRRTVRRKGFRPVTVTIITTLLDPQRYPAGDLVALRMRRWEVETDLRHLKTTLNMNVLRSQSVEGVTRELAAFMLVYNLVRATMLGAALRQRVSVARVSFADALYYLRYGDRAAAAAAHGGNRRHCPPCLRINPRRHGRVEPRVVKRRRNRYTLMTKPRDQLRKELRIKRLTI